MPAIVREVRNQPKRADSQWRALLEKYRSIVRWSVNLSVVVADPAVMSSTSQAKQIAADIDSAKSFAGFSSWTATLYSPLMMRDGQEFYGSPSATASVTEPTLTCGLRLRGFRFRAVRRG